jgi:hypothetical protein
MVLSFFLLKVIYPKKFKHKHDMKTYDIVFQDSENSNQKGFQISLEEAKVYIKENNGTSNSYFADYKGGIVQVVDNESGEVEYEEQVK